MGQGSCRVQWLPKAVMGPPWVLPAGCFMRPCIALCPGAAEIRGWDPRLGPQSKHGLLAPTGTALPSSSRCCRGSQQPPRVKPSHGPLSLAAGMPQWRVAKDTAHSGAWQESFIHSSHHQLRPGSSECPGAGTGATRFIINWVARGGTRGPWGHSGVTAQQRAQPPAPGDLAAPAQCLAALALAPLSSWPAGR